MSRIIIELKKGKSLSADTTFPWVLPMEKIVKKVCPNVDTGMSGMGGGDGEYIVKKEKDALLSMFKRSGFKVMGYSKAKGYSVKSKESDEKGISIYPDEDSEDFIISWFSDLSEFS